MRIILSPTKQMKREEELHFSLSEPVFIEKTKVLSEYLKGLPYEVVCEQTTANACELFKII